MPELALYFWRLRSLKFVTSASMLYPAPNPQPPLVGQFPYALNLDSSTMTLADADAGIISVPALTLSRATKSEPLLPMWPYAPVSVSSGGGGSRNVWPNGGGDVFSQSAYDSDYYAASPSVCSGSVWTEWQFCGTSPWVFPYWVGGGAAWPYVKLCGGLYYPYISAIVQLGFETTDEFVPPNSGGGAWGPGAAGSGGNGGTIDVIGIQSVPFEDSVTATTISGKIFGKDAKFYVSAPSNPNDSGALTLFASMSIEPVSFFTFDGRFDGSSGN